MRLCLVIILILASSIFSFAAYAVESGFGVAKVTPPAGALNVDLNPLIQIHTSEKFDPATVDDSAIYLTDREDKKISAVVTADLGGVVSLSPEQPLQPDTEYRIHAKPSLKSTGGASLTPFSSRFRTADEPAPPEDAPEYL